MSSDGALLAVSALQAGAAAKTRKPTVGVKFAKQLTSLVGTIEATDAHFIRCIKPNSSRSASAFEPRLTLEQLRYSGVFEAVAIRKCGYPFRLTRMQFVNRYRCLLPSAERAAVGYDASKGAVEALLKRLAAPPCGFDTSELRIGSTLVFYRAALSRALEGAREAYVSKVLALLQRVYRAGIARSARRKLAAARDNLAAAVSAKELEALNTALEAAATPVRAFHHRAPIEFTLHVPGLAEITALQADLREEVHTHEHAVGVAACARHGAAGRPPHPCLPPHTRIPCAATRHS